MRSIIFSCYIDLLICYGSPGAVEILRVLTAPGDYSGEATPVPIPNTVVKLSHADDTENTRESR